MFIRWSFINYIEDVLVYWQAQVIMCPRMRNSCRATKSIYYTLSTVLLAFQLIGLLSLVGVGAAQGCGDFTLSSKSFYAPEFIRKLKRKLSMFLRPFKCWDYYFIISWSPKTSLVSLFSSTAKLNPQITIRVNKFLPRKKRG